MESQVKEQRQPLCAFPVFPEAVRRCFETQALVVDEATAEAKQREEEDERLDTLLRTTAEVLSREVGHLESSSLGSDSAVALGGLQHQESGSLDGDSALARSGLLPSPQKPERSPQNEKAEAAENVQANGSSSMLDQQSEEPLADETPAEGFARLSAEVVAYLEEQTIARPDYLDSKEYVTLDEPEPQANSLMAQDVAIRSEVGRMVFHLALARAF